MSTDIQHEIYVARYYQNKVSNARKAGHEFTLNLVSVRNLLMAKRCYYTGVELTRPELNKNGCVYESYKPRLTDVTIDRIDQTKGYEKGNVVACSKGANAFKSYFENAAQTGYELKHLLRMANKITKLDIA